MHTLAIAIEFIFLSLMFIFLSIFSYISHEDAYAIEKYSPKVVIVPLGRPFLYSSENADIYANVTDKYGDIDKEKAVLMYSVNDSKWQSTKMDLIDGTLSNGYYYGTIPAQGQNSTVKYKLQFQDNLNYSYISDEYKYNVSELTNDQSPEIDPSTSKDTYYSDQSVIVKADVSDGSGTGIKNVTLNYSIGSNSENKTTNMNLYTKAGSGRYLALIPPTNESNFTTVNYYVTAFDNLGNKGQGSGNYNTTKMNRIFSNKINTSMSVDELDSRNLNSKIKISIIGENINESTIHNMPILVGNGDINNTDKALSIWFEKEPINNSVMGVKLTKSQDINSSFSLFGPPTLFPFDTYYLNLITEIPISNATINDNQVNFAPAVNSSWIPHVSYNETNNESNPISEELCNKITEFKGYQLCKNVGVTFKNIRITFERNYTIQAILIPIIAIFFLLGSIFVLKTLSEDLSNRLVLTLSIFAFIFTFTPIIDGIKPTNIFSLTIADFLITVLIVATIAFSVSSVIASVYGRIWIDKVMLIFVVILILSYGYQFSYGGPTAWWVFPIIILGLGYGFLLKIPWRNLLTLKYSKFIPFKKN
jgi:hypothetical protein